MLILIYISYNSVYLFCSGLICFRYKINVLNLFYFVSISSREACIEICLISWV